MMSAMCWLLPGMSRKIPRPTVHTAPWSRPKLSVQPGIGSYAAAPMIEGFRMTIGILVVLKRGSSSSHMRLE